MKKPLSVNLGELSFADFISMFWRKKPLLFNHFIADFPPDYLTVDRMGQLLDSSHQVIFRPGNIPQSTPSNETLERFSVDAGLEKYLAASNIHFSIHKAEKEDAVIAEFSNKLEAFFREMFKREGDQLLQSGVILFMASPNAVAKYHADPNNSFLFQLWGKKTIFVYPESDPEVFPDTDKELFASNSTTTQIKFYDKCKLVEQAFSLQPCDTLYVPAMWPHWVQGGSDPSLSLSIQFEFESDYKRLRILRYNSWLRRMGRRPKRPGHSRYLDEFKNTLISLYERVHNLVNAVR